MWTPLTSRYCRVPTVTPMNVDKDLANPIKNWATPHSWYPEKCQRQPGENVTQPGAFLSCALKNQIINRFLCVTFSVVDPWHFVPTHPDPRIRTTDLRIRIRLRILLFSSVLFKMGLIICFAYYLLKVHLRQSSKIRSHKKSQNSRKEEGFLLGRIRIRIRVAPKTYQIRIHNTG
jgi:hypothetical protein